MDSLQRWKTQYRFYRTFFLSTLKFSVLIGFLFASFSALRFYVSIIDSIYKELTRKEEYFFYYNQGIGKYQLWIVTFIVMFICCNLLNQIIELCTQALK